MIRAFVDEPGLDRDLLKNRAALTDAVANVKKTLRVMYPKLEPTLEIMADEEHQSNKVLCRLQASGAAFGLDVTHDLVGSADFRELQKLAPSAIGLGRAPYKLKAKGEEQELRSTADLVRTILDLGKQGLWPSSAIKLGEMNPGQLWETTMNPEAGRCCGSNSKTCRGSMRSSRFSWATKLSRAETSSRPMPSKCEI